MQPLFALDNNTIRRLNLLRLIEDAKTVNELSRRTGVDRVVIFQRMSKSKNKASTRNIGDDVAHRLEDGMGKARGWMDVLDMEQGHIAAAQRIFEQLLELPREKLEALSALLDIALDGRNSK